MNPRSNQVESLLKLPFVVMGHRGAKGLAPENTVSSFRAGLKHTNYFELDTFKCGSGELIVLHDETLDRTTNGSGFAAKKPWAELENLDAGSHFQSEFSNERIPLLESLLMEFPSSVVWDIELKVSHSDSERNELASAILDLLKKLNKEDQVFVSSFDPLVLGEIKARNPKILRGLLLEKGIGDFERLTTEPDILLPHFESCTEAFMEKAKGTPVIPYTANEPKDWKRLMQIGVRGIITDFPDRLALFLSKK